MLAQSNVKTERVQPRPRAPLQPSIPEAEAEAKPHPSAIPVNAGPAASTLHQATRTLDAPPAATDGAGLDP